MVANNNEFDPSLMTVKEVAKRLKISPSMVYSLVERGLLASFRLGRAVRVSAAQVEAFLTKNEKTEASNPVERKRFRHLRF